MWTEFFSTLVLPILLSKLIKFDVLTCFTVAYNIMFLPLSKISVLIFNFLQLNFYYFKQLFFHKCIVSRLRITVRRRKSLLKKKLGILDKSKNVI